MGDLAASQIARCTVLTLNLISKVTNNLFFPKTEKKQQQQQQQKKQ